VFVPKQVLEKWEEAVQNKSEEEMTRALKRITEEYDLEHLSKILWK
jgi:hypothetical protein